MTDDKNQAVTVDLKENPATVNAGGGDDNHSCWTAAPFAEDWYLDALNEARTDNGYNSRRREILFAACFAESYLFEWIRKIVQIGEIKDYYPESEKHKGPKWKWKNLPKRLHKARKIDISHNYKLNSEELKKLIDDRNDLVHANVSWPTPINNPQEEKLLLTKEDLTERKPGYAVNIVYDLVVKLNKACGLQPPDYLKRP